MTIRVIVTDIEGTTSSIGFVKDILFPYARERLPPFIEANRTEPQVRHLLNEVRGMSDRPLSDAKLASMLQEWIDEDRKATPLKDLQGLVWQAGYENGDFTAHLYEDAVRALRAWRDAGLLLHVYSSGSIHAQKLFFAHTVYGDLTPLFSGYFDTGIGPKQERGSYQRIASSIARAPDEILFLSDAVAELDAAAASGMRTVLVARGEGTVDAGVHPLVRNFDEIEP